MSEIRRITSLIQVSYVRQGEPLGLGGGEAGAGRVETLIPAGDALALCNNAAIADDGAIVGRHATGRELSQA